MSSEAHSDDCHNDEPQATEVTDDDDLEPEPEDDAEHEAGEEPGEPEVDEDGCLRGTKAFAVSSNKKLTSRFRGVCWNKKNKRWQAAINSSGRYLYLGSYASEEEAAKAFDKAALRIRGKKARLNYRYCDYIDGDGVLVEDKHIDLLLEQAKDPTRHRRRVNRKCKVTTICVPHDAEEPRVEQPPPPLQPQPQPPPQQQQQPTPQEEAALQPTTVVSLRPNFLESFYAYPRMQSLPAYPGSAFTLFNSMQGAVPAFAALSGGNFEPVTGFQHPPHSTVPTSAQVVHLNPTHQVKQDAPNVGILKQSFPQPASAAAAQDAVTDPSQRYPTVVSLEAFQRDMLYPHNVQAQYAGPPQLIGTRPASEPQQTNKTTALPPQTSLQPAPQQQQPQQAHVQPPVVTRGEEPLRISDFNLIRQHLPEGATLDSLVPGDDTYVGVMYSVEGSNRIAGAVFDGSTLRSMGLFDTEKDAKQACQSSIGLLSELKARLQTPEEKQPVPGPSRTSNQQQVNVQQGFQSISLCNFPAPSQSGLQLPSTSKQDMRQTPAGFDWKEPASLDTSKSNRGFQMFSPKQRYDVSEGKPLDNSCRSPQNVAMVKSISQQLENATRAPEQAGTSVRQGSAAEFGRGPEQMPEQQPTNWNITNLAAVLDPNILADNSEYVLVPSQYYPVLHSKQLLENLVFIQQQGAPQPSPFILPDVYKSGTSDKVAGVPYPMMHPSGVRVEHLLISPWGNVAAQQPEQLGATFATAGISLPKHVSDSNNSLQVHEVTDESSQNPAKVDDGAGQTVDNMKRKFSEDSSSVRSKKGKYQPPDGFKQLQELKEITVQQALEVYRTYGSRPLMQNTTQRQQ